MTNTIRWIESSSPELDFFNLPHRIPWPGDVEEPDGPKRPLQLEHLMKALDELGPEAGQEWRNFAQAAERFGELTEALQEHEITRAAELLEEVETLHPGSAFALCNRAHIARTEGRETEAIALFQQAAEKAPRVGVTWINLGSTLLAAGRREEAAAALQQALQVEPNNPIALDGLASLRVLFKLKANDPQNPNAYVFVDGPTFANIATQHIGNLTDPDQLRGYAEQLLRDGMAPQAALESLKKADTLRPDDPLTLFALSGAHHALGQLEPAREAMTKFTALRPDDPQGFFRLAQIAHALKEEEAEQRHLARALEVEPNFQPALAVRFQLGPVEHDPAKQDALEKFGAERNSWMAYLLAGAIAHQRGDWAGGLRETERALAIAPDVEQVLLNHAVSLGRMKELAKLAAVIRPAVESRKYSKQLDWNYAHVLHELGMDKDAIAVLRQASVEAPPDFQKMAETSIDAWSGLVTGSGVRLDINPAGFLLRPILITLQEGDGGVVLDFARQLPAEGRFPWRATGNETTVRLQQGHSGAQAPKSLGNFRVRGVRQAPTGPTTVECHVAAMPDGSMHFRALQDGRKLPVGWIPSSQA